MTPFLNIERDGGIVTLTLNRPEKRNAISTRAECEEVEAACRSLSRDDSVRCVIVTGAGSAFWACAIKPASPAAVRGRRFANPIVAVFR